MRQNQALRPRPAIVFGQQRPSFQAEGTEESKTSVTQNSAHYLPGLATSVCTARTSAPALPSSCSASLSGSSSMSAITVRAATFENASANARPIPLAAPVMTTTFPWRSCMLEEHIRQEAIVRWYPGTQLLQEVSATHSPYLFRLTTKRAIDIPSSCRSSTCTQAYRGSTCVHFVTPPQPSAPHCSCWPLRSLRSRWIDCTQKLPGDLRPFCPATRTRQSPKPRLKP